MKILKKSRRKSPISINHERKSWRKLWRKSWRKSVIIFLLILSFVGILILLIKAVPKTKCACESYCLIDNVITVRMGGRLGNCVWEYISALGIGDYLGLCPYVPKGILDCLGKVFKNLKIPAYEDTLLSDYCREIHRGDFKRCESKTLSQNGTAWDHLCYTLKYGESFSSGDAHKPIAILKKLKDTGQLPSIFILPQWIAHIHVFAQVGFSRFKQELQFQDDVLQLAEATLNGVKKKVGHSDLIFVGVHVRRTDYNRYLKGHFGQKVAIADLDYYKRAMSRMNDIYYDSRIVFVVVSDDYTWCNNYLVNEKDSVYWGGLEHSCFINNWREKRDMSVGHDLAVLALQNHSIIGYGTYAVTGSLLSGGNTIVSNIKRYGSIHDNLSTYLSNVLPNWLMM